MILHATSTASLIKIKDLHYANNTSFKNHIYRIFVEKRAAPFALAPWATKVVLCKQSCYSVYWRLRRFCQWNKPTESMSLTLSQMKESFMIISDIFIIRNAHALNI